MYDSRTTSVLELTSTSRSPRSITQVLTNPQYQNSDWAAAFTSQFDEYEYYVTEIEGEVPATLRGTLFRNGPGRFERGEQKYEHMLDGDGYVQSFSFGDDGSVFFRSKYVRTKYAFQCLCLHLALAALCG